MKPQNLIFTILIFLFTISFLPENSENVSTNFKQLQEELTSTSLNDGYTYVRVNKDGVWWIYVYDGTILIHYYPEE